jgi:hypothetical protein
MHFLNFLLPFTLLSPAKLKTKSLVWQLIPVIPATWEVEITWEKS